MESIQFDRELIKPNAKVFAKGERVGSVDAIEGEYLKLNRKDADDRMHHWIPLSWVVKIVDSNIYIDHNVTEFKSQRRNSKPIM